MTILDLTQTISVQMPVFPGTERPIITQATTINKEGFAEKLLHFYSHTGTHIDSPAHILEGKRSLDQFDASMFVGKGLVIDVSKCDEGVVGVDHLICFQQIISEIEFLLFYSGQDKKWGDESYYSNFPVLSNDAAQWLCKFSLKGVGYDSISADPISSSELPNHRILLGNDMIIIENLCNLEMLIGEEFLFSCLPLKIKDSDGSPVRAVGIIMNNED